MQNDLHHEAFCDFPAGKLVYTASVGICCPPLFIHASMIHTFEYKSAWLFLISEPAISISLCFISMWLLAK